MSAAGEARSPKGLSLRESVEADAERYESRDSHAEAER
jgi:hypothetical protein